MSKNLVLSLAGKDIPLRHQISKGGNPYWAVLAKRSDGSRYMSLYGVPIPALESKLPSRVGIVDPETGDEIVLDLEHTLTTKGQPKVAFSGALDLPNGERRTVTVSVSVTTGGAWNLIAKAIGASGRITQVDDL